MNIRQNMKTIDSGLHFWKKNEKKNHFFKWML